MFIRRAFDNRERSGWPAGRLLSRQPGDDTSRPRVAKAQLPGRRQTTPKKLWSPVVYPGVPIFLSVLLTIEPQRV